MVKVYRDGVEVRNVKLETIAFLITQAKNKHDISVKAETDSRVSYATATVKMVNGDVHIKTNENTTSTTHKPPKSLN